MRILTISSWAWASSIQVSWTLNGLGLILLESALFSLCLIRLLTALVWEISQISWTLWTSMSLSTISHISGLRSKPGFHPSKPQQFSALMVSSSMNISTGFKSLPRPRQPKMKKTSVEFLVLENAHRKSSSWSQVCTPCGQLMQMTHLKMGVSLVSKYMEHILSTCGNIQQIIGSVCTITTQMLKIGGSITTLHQVRFQFPRSQPEGSQISTLCCPLRIQRELLQSTNL